MANGNNTQLDPNTGLPIKDSKPLFGESEIRMQPTFFSRGTTASPIGTQEELETYTSRGIPVYEDSDVESLQEARAQEQGALDVLGNTQARFFTGLIPEIAGSVGGVIDAVDFINLDGEFGNALTRWSDQAKQIVDEEWFPVYRSKNSGFMDVGNPEWWLENGSSLQRSATGFVITGAGTGSVIRGAAGLVRGQKLLQALGLGTKSAQKIGLGTESFANTYLLNHAEGVLEATQVHKDVKDYWLTNGLSEQDAELRAAEAASATVNANRVNLLLNLTSAAKFLRPYTNTATRELLKNPSKLNTLKQMGLEGLQEAGEESVNLLASEYGQSIGKGTPYEGWDKLFSAEGLETAFLGALGGAGQTGLTALANTGYIGSKNPVSRIKDPETGDWISKADYQRKIFAAQQSEVNKMQETFNNERVKSYTNVFNNYAEQEELNQQYQDALVKNDKEKLDEIASKSITIQAIQAFDTGTAQILEDQFKKLSNMDEVSASNAGLDTDPKSPEYYKKRANIAIDYINQLEKIYTNTQNFVNRLPIEGNYAEDYKKQKVKDLTKIAGDLLYTSNKIDEYTSLQVEAKALNTQMGIDVPTAYDPIIDSLSKRKEKLQEKLVSAYNNKTVEEGYTEYANKQTEAERIYNEEDSPQAIVQKQQEAIAKVNTRLSNLEQEINNKGYSANDDIEVSYKGIPGKLLANQNYNFSDYQGNILPIQDVIADIIIANKSEVSDIEKRIYTEGLDSFKAAKEIDTKDTISDTPVKPITNQELDEVSESFKSTNLFYTTGRNVKIDSEAKGRDKDLYNEKGMPVFEDFPNMIRWFKYLDTQDLPKDAKLKVFIRGDESTGQSKYITQLINEELELGGISPQNRTTKDIYVALVNNEDKFIEFEDNILYRSLPITDTLLGDNSKIAERTLIELYQKYAKIEVGKDGDKYIILHDNKVYTYSEEEFRNKMMTFLRKKYQGNIDKLKTGDIIPIAKITNGILLKSKEGNKYKYNPISKVLSSRKAYLDAQGNPVNFNIQIATDAPVIFNNETYKFSKGSIVVTIGNKDLLPVTSKTIDEDTVSTVLQVLKQANSETGLKTKLKLPESIEYNGTVLNEVSLFPVKGSALNVISQLINYTSEQNPDNWKEGNMSIQKGKVIFKDKEGFSEINLTDLDNSDLNSRFVQFLSTKRHNILKDLINSKPYYHPVFDKALTFKKYDSYYQYMVEVLETPGNPIDGQLFASRNIVLDTTDNGDINVISSTESSEETPSIENMLAMFNNSKDQVNDLLKSMGMGQTFEEQKTEPIALPKIDFSIEELTQQIQDEITKLEEAKDRKAANRLRVLLTSAKGNKDKLIELVQKNCK